jgi:glycosyltransferase involved in cell wall biosynthesis
MKISVIVRTCNRPEFLQEALLSIELQTHKDWEVIIFDDGDSSENQEIINLFKLNNPSKRVIYYNEGGKRFLFKESWIIAPKLSNGDLMIRLDDDDILDTECLEFVSKVFSETPDLDFAYGTSAFFRGRKVENIIDINTPHDFAKTTATWEGYIEGHPYKHPWRFKQDAFEEPKYISSLIHASKLNYNCLWHPYIMRTNSVLNVIDKIKIESNFVDDLEFLGSLDNLGLSYNKLNKILLYSRRHDNDHITEPGKVIDGKTLWEDILEVRDRVDILRPSGIDFESSIVPIKTEGNENELSPEELQTRFENIINRITDILNPKQNFVEKFDWRLF